MTRSAGTSASGMRAHAELLLWAGIVGISFPAVDLLTPGLPPLLLTALRLAIAALAIGFLVRRTHEPPPTLPGIVLYATLGLSLAGFFGAMFWAAHHVTALAMATLYVSVPLVAYFLGRLLRVERADAVLLLGLLLGAAGALSLSWAGSGPDGFAFSKAEALYFAGCVASALYPVLSKWGLQQGWLTTNAALRTFWSLSAGGILIGLIGLGLEPFEDLYRMTGRDFLLIAYLGIFSSGVTFWLVQRGTTDLKPSVVTAYTYLIPFVSMILLFFAEPDLAGWKWVPGSVAVIVAMRILIRRSSQPAASEEQSPDPLGRKVEQEGA